MGADTTSGSPGQLPGVHPGAAAAISIVPVPQDIMGTATFDEYDAHGDYIGTVDNTSPLGMQPSAAK